MNQNRRGRVAIGQGFILAEVFMLSLVGLLAGLAQPAWAAESTGGYSSGRTGSLMVTIQPSGARAAGAQWRVDNGVLRNSGTTATGLAAGQHTLSFKAISGWTTPANQTVRVASRTTTSATGRYTATVAQTGSLTVTLQPAGAVSAGAQWQVDGGALRNSGTTATGLSTGSHTVAFKAVAGFTTPASQTVTVNANATTTATGTYVAVVQTGSLTVTILPAAAVTAGAQWQVDGGATHNSGATATGLSTGSHTVAFKAVTGFTTPASQNVTVNANATTTATGTYVAIAQTGSLTVTILPGAAVTAGAQWQVDGGALRNSGTTATGLSTGSHALAFKAVTGYTTPASQTVTINANATSAATGMYAASGGQAGSLTVTILPAAAVTAGAQWQVDAGLPHASGTSVTGLPAGTHTVSFSVIAKWIKPLSQTIALTAGQTASITGTYTQQLSSTNMVVLGYSELGMHCMNEDFSEFMILPPYNNFHAQVIQRGGEPRLIQSGVTVSYTIPSNTTSVNKTNFWTYAPALFGQTFAPDFGLTGNGLSGTMVSGAAAGRSDWGVTGIPITPLEDDGAENPYALATVTVAQNGQDVAQTQAVVPVSWEISCNLCHNTPGVTPGMDILNAHDRLHGTHLAASTPVACGGCHAQPELGFVGDTTLPSLSSAMHTAHAPRMAQAGLDVACYACHPGIRTQCLRDVHYSRGMTCTDCHGDMTAVANPARTPWVDEPSCGGCHASMAPSGYQFEQANTLFRNSRGHHNVMCASCHGSPHAITPTTKIEDNIQAIAVQGHAGTIDTCTVCHTQTPNESFPHSLGD